MTIADPIYGSFDIHETVILELLEDPAVVRCKFLKQGGTTELVNSWKDFSRYEHCVGAMLLVRHLGGSIEEQIAALLHDISHTAFSHVVDVVFSKNETQNYHEEIKRNIILESNIPSILKRHNIDLEFILDEDHFYLLERSAPDLCADRVDYALRAFAYYFDKLAISKQLFKSLITVENEIVFKDIESARIFAELFLTFTHTVVASLRDMASYYILADAIRFGLNNLLISQSDLLFTDDQLWQKLKELDINYINTRLSLLNPKLLVKQVESTDTFHYMMVTKPRWVDPKVYSMSNLSRTFESDPSLINKFSEYSNWIKQPFYVVVEGL